MSQKQMEAYGQKPWMSAEICMRRRRRRMCFLADLENNGNPYLVVSRPAPGVGAYAPVVYWLCQR